MCASVAFFSSAVLSCWFVVFFFFFSFFISSSYSLFFLFRKRHRVSISHLCSYWLMSLCAYNGTWCLLRYVLSLHYTRNVQWKEIQSNGQRTPEQLHQNANEIEQDDEANEEMEENAVWSNVMALDTMKDMWQKYVGYHEIDPCCSALRTIGRRHNYTENGKLFVGMENAVCARAQ